MPKIYLSPSTQEFNPYIIGGSEELYMNLIADAMMPYLRSSGIVTIRNTPQMTAASSIVQSNQNNVDLHVALHSNAAPERLSGQLSGSEVYFDPSDPKSEKFANIVVNNLKKIYYNPDDVTAIPTDFLGEVLRTKAPAVLIEYAYHDNEADALWIKNNIEKIARNTVQSITEYFGIPFVEAQPMRVGNVKVDFGNLNIRSLPTTNSTIVAKAPKDAEILILGETDGWYVVQYLNSTGYVDKRYIVIS